MWRGVWVISGPFKAPPGSKHSGNLPNSRTVVLKSDLLHSSKTTVSLAVFRDLNETESERERERSADHKPVSVYREQPRFGHERLCVKLTCPGFYLLLIIIIIIFYIIQRSAAHKSVK